MIDPLAIAVAAVLGLIGLLHLGWAFGLRWPGSDEVSLAETVGGVAPGGRMHPPWMCALVALAIGAAVAVVLAQAFGALPSPSSGLVFIAYLGLIAVFVLRGLAGFAPAIWRHTEGTPFQRLNRRYYSPLCLLLGAGLIGHLIRG